MGQLEFIHPLHQIIIAILLGLFVGLQRQWEDAPLGGIRTFSLVSLVGALAANLSQVYGPLLIVVGAIGVIAFVINGLRASITDGETTEKLRLSTEVSILAMYFVGSLVVVSPLWIAVSSAGAIAVILQSKVELHEFATRFTAKELKSIMQFVVLAVIIFPIIPNKTIDPLSVINPHEVWFMVVLIVGLGLFGYVGYKFFGKSAGILLSGILGGLISSTATTMNYAKTARHKVSPSFQASAIILIAWTIVYLRLGVEIIFVSPSFFSEVAFHLGILFLLSLFISLGIWVRVRKDKTELLVQENPSEIRIALVFGIIYSVVVFSVAFAKKLWANEALYVIAFLSGITDLDAITLSTANLVENSNLSAQEGKNLLLVAAAANTMFKGGLFLFVAGLRNSYPVIISTIVTLVGCFIMYFYF